MRRGHSGIGGWRSENPNHFRPRNSGPPRFRPPRSFGILDTPRFPPPNPRLHHRGGHPFNTHSGHADDHLRHDYHERHKQNRDGHHHINQRPERGHSHSRARHPHLNTNIRQKNSDQSSLYQDNSIFYKDVHPESFHINSMGDVDHRQIPSLISHPHPQESYKQQRISQWINPSYDNRKHNYEERSPQKSFRQQESAEASKIPVLDYGGHRPPSSDHYGSTSGPNANNNNTSFSRSVDDTVDIIRKRLLNRNESQNIPQHASDLPRNNEQEVTENVNQHTQQEQPTKKRTPKQRHNIKSNCDKMKTNIVHQLFKMDKDKMHKLMDDPGSSTKFEYAISSLITESQNSLNRHLRSVAEKSLYSSGTDFIHNDNNTIYEDTFMKQMQCLLDPQDTVLLEDIKPIVMAELSKVLQLDDFEQRFDAPEDQSVNQSRDNQSNYPYFEPYNYNDYPQEKNYEHEQIPSFNNDNLKTINVSDEIDSSYNYDRKPVYEEPRRLFERRPPRSQSIQSEDRRRSSESQQHRRSIDNSAEDLFKSKQDEPLPLFDTSNMDDVSEDEDTFAELDRQYHVAVDPNFLENDDLSARGTPTTFQPLPKESMNIKKEIDCHSVKTNNLPLFSETSRDRETLKEISQFIKQEVASTLDFSKENTTPVNADVPRVEHINTHHEYATKPKESSKDTEKSSNSNIIKTPSSNSRKRSTDQRPSHRKEKRKKRSSSQSESIKTPSEVNVSNASAKSAEKCNVTPKSYYSMFLPKDDSNKDSSIDKKLNNADKSYSEKYVKRKEASKKPKGKETEEPRRKRHSSSSHPPPILSPKDSINSSSQTPTKSDTKTKLKSIDMFVEKPKKPSIHHHAHRNTASTVTPTKPTAEESKPKQATTPVRNKAALLKDTEIIKKSVAKETQTVQSNVLTSRFCQTDSIKLVSKSIQTEPVTFHTTKHTSTDAFERMKEIDMEIQVLLQEKFKLYSSIENKDEVPITIPTLGMTVLNVTNESDTMESLTQNLMTVDVMSTDAIVEEFTSMPVEELEEIALESVEEQFESTKIETRRQRQKVLQQERNSSESPTCSKRLKKKAKPPNISLIEQIITDDRPLEDIISLDDLEEPPSKTKKKAPKSQPKKKNAKKGKAGKNTNASMYDIKDCSVVLVRTDVNKMFSDHSQSSETSEMSQSTVERASPVVSVKPQPSQVEDSVVNDLQFDMLDVSEDIVIEDSETKAGEEKEHDREVISEEIILDNSQSSADDVFASEAGQSESECKTYDYSTDEKLRRDSVTVTGNADAVLAIECIENDFIAACLDGNVYHFSNDGQLLNTLRGSNLAVTCLTIVKEKYGTTVYTGSLDSRIRYYDLETGLEKGPECNVLSPIQTMDRAWDTVFVGTRTGFVLQFECKNNMLIPVSTVKFSEQSILALRAIKEGPRKVLLVAARSENVTIKDAQTGLLLRTLCGPKMTVYTLLFEDGKVFCGTSSHQIHVFDYASGAHTGCHEGGKGAVCLRATGGLLFAGCYDGCVYIYREGDTRPLAQLRGPSLMLLSLAVVGSKIIAGYKDRSLYIWKIPLSILQEMIL
ncbi:unnamed protein product [Chrysodeixis includens]|uniref:Zinc finger protein 106 n=1 Tax=Chrysodeixis includens TaxID=689277 RepID=A0A9P0FVH6_CHRIL|nr:unnamed protein product [Chrysodeixis includens]